jgi:tetratricopeptide (TPR) repeat protein
MNAQSLLSHQAGSMGHHNAAFLQHHGGATTNLGGRQTGLANNLGANSLHHGGVNNGNMHSGNMHHGNGNRNHNRNNNGFFPFFGFFPFGFGGFGFGYPFYGLGYGYGGYGYGGYGYGLGGYGYPYGSYGYNAYPYYGSGGYASYAPAQAAAPVSPTATDDAKIFAEKGENDFKAGNYKAAAYAWRHAAVDDPKNGVLMMMLGQALFAAGQYDEAAGATQAAMQLLPEDQWGVVVKNFRELYGRQGDYTTQLRALEKDVKTNADNPATRFLLGFHYGYLGYPSHAVKQLDKTLTLAPADPIAKKLREAMAAPKPGDQKPADDADGDKDQGDKSAKDGKAPDKPAAAKAAVDT